jgi:hypothetical protein
MIMLWFIKFIGRVKIAVQNKNIMGIVISLLVYVTLFLFSIVYSKYFLYNGIKFEWNLIGLIILTYIFYWQILRLLHLKKIFAFVVFIIFISGELNMALSFIVDLIHRINKYDLNTNDMSFFIVYPVIFIFTILLGYFFDKKTNSMNESKNVS